MQTIADTMRRRPDFRRAAAFWRRTLLPPEKPWQAPGDLPLGALLLVILFVAIYLNGTGPWYANIYH